MVAAGWLIALLACSGGPAPRHDDPTQIVVQVRLRDGRTLEGLLRTTALDVVTPEPTTRRLAADEILSIHLGAAASPFEATRIDNDLALLDGTDMHAIDDAIAELTDIGLPVMTPLLRSLADRDGREPDPRMRLFARIVPGDADRADRTLDLIRLADGSSLRGRVLATDLGIDTPAGTHEQIRVDDLRRLAVRRKRIEKVFDLDAMRDCTYVAFLDTGIGLTSTSTIRSDAEGLVRLSFDEDGWSADPDGIKEPLPGKRKLQEGFRWGSVLGRVGTTGERWFAGARAEKSGLPEGRLYYVINDNEHWQNNIGSFRVRLTATDAYDLGDAR